jgi:hypothetical protein
MKFIYRKHSIEFAVSVFALLFFSASALASAGEFYPSYQARIVGHLALNRKSTTQQMLLQHEGKKKYLYVKEGSQQGYTVVDVTKPTRPKVVAQVPEQNLTMADPGIALATAPESAMKVSSNRSKQTQVPRTVRVVDVSDPSHPRTVKTFQDVTSIANDHSRHLIYVANAEGIWILSDHKILRRHYCTSSDAISSAEPNCL